MKGLKNIMRSQDEESKKKLLELLPGQDQSQKLRNVFITATQESDLALRCPFKEFLSDLQRGRFTKMFEVESALQKQLTVEHYEEQMVKNIEKYYKKTKTLQLRKRHPLES